MNTSCKNYSNSKEYFDKRLIITVPILHAENCCIRELALLLRNTGHIKTGILNMSSKAIVFDSTLRITPIPSGLRINILGLKVFLVLYVPTNSKPFSF